MIRTSVIAFFAALLLWGCGSSKEIDNGLVWPSPPDEPRIRYVTTYRNENDFKTGVGKTLESLSGDRTVTGFARPFDVTGDNRGHIYVTDAVQGVMLIDLNKNEFRRITCDQCGFSINNARGLAADTARLFVGLADRGQVVVLDHEGKLLDTLGARGSLPNPIDVVLDTLRNRVYVVDNRLHQVKVFRPNGDTLFTIGERGVEDGQFNFPQSLAVAPDGSIYVVDAFNFRIQVFDSTGHFVRKFGRQGDGWGMFAMPKGIALDAHGNIYVLDAQHQHFQIFNNQGELLLFVGKYSSGNDGFTNPVSIYIDRDQRIYVTDQLNSRVQVFELIKGN